MTTLLGYGISFVSFVLAVLSISYIKNFLSAYVANDMVLTIITYIAAYSLSFFVLPNLFAKIYEVSRR